MKALITGGAGYIGSSIANRMMDDGHQVIVFDDLSTGRSEFVPRAKLYLGDFADEKSCLQLFSDHPDIDAVIHCAAKIVVPESTVNPLLYYDNNVGKTIRFLRLAADHGISRIIFSSTASMYDVSDGGVANEDSRVRPLSPYSRSKWMVEQVLADFCAASPVRALLLRYFNPIGADPKLRSGHPSPEPTHVVGKLITAMSTNAPFHLTGIDWPTRDGSAVRDYVDVWDLAEAHALAVERFDKIFAAEADGTIVVNLGTGRGVTVRELLRAFQQSTRARLNVVETVPRPGDVAGAYASNERASQLLGWRPTRSLDESISTAVRWAAVRSELLGR